MSDVSYAPMRRDQAGTLASLTNRAYRHDEIPMGMTAGEFIEMFDEPHFDADLDTLVASEHGEAVAWCRVWHTPSVARQERAYVFGQVDSSFRRRGIGTRLIEWGFERARMQLLARDNDLPKYLRMDAAPSEDDKRTIMGRLGMAPVRYFDTMTRPLSEPLPEIVTDGFEVLAWDQDRSEEIRMVSTTAFADHWGTAGIDKESWDAWMKQESIRLDLSFIAVDGLAVIAYSANARHKGDTEVHGRHEAWFDSLGTLRERRGRGVATALITASMRAMAAAGFESAGLVVDSANPTGAHGLYTRLGFKVAFRSTMYQHEVKRPTD